MGTYPPKFAGVIDITSAEIHVTSGIKLTQCIGIRSPSLRVACFCAVPRDAASGFIMLIERRV